MKKLYDKIHNVDTGLLGLRLGLAAVFIAHGWAKLQNIDGTTQFFSSLGFGVFWVYVVALVEFFGGIAMLVGLLSRFAGFLLVINMFTAIYLVKWPKGLMGGYEFELILLLAALAIHFAGPGKYSIWKKW